MDQVHIESDSQQLVQAISSESQDLALNDALFREIKFLIRLNFNVFEISYSPRACNQVADALATSGARLGRSNPDIWPGCAPSFVNVLVASDSAGLTRF